MRFEIDSSSISFNGSGFLSFFESLNDACIQFDVSYFVVGAFARDIILENIFGQRPGLITQDIDVAIALDSWNAYDQFIDYLVSHHGFSRTRVPHRFQSAENVLTDIIPYGRIEKGRTISFPPKFSRVLNTIGFQEIYASTIDIVFDQSVAIKIVSSEAFTIVKFIAWKDREPEEVSKKHVQDIYLIIGGYFEAKVDDFAKEFADLFDMENFDQTICGAMALGRRVKQICLHADKLSEELNRIFRLILLDEENSLFVNQLTRASSRDYPFCLRVIKSLITSFNNMK